MKARCLIGSILVVVLIVGAVRAQQPGATDTNREAISQPEGVLAPVLSQAQQRPILLLLRERELLNAKIDGAALALLAFLGLSSSEWDLVTADGGIKIVPLKPKPTAPPQGEIK